MPNFAPAWCPVGDHLCAQFLEIHHLREHSDVARGLADIGWREAKRRCRSPVEADNREVAANHDDGKIDRVEDADEVGAERVRTHGIAMRPGDIAGPAIRCRRGFRHRSDSSQAVYRVRVRCSTASATSGRAWRSANSSA